MVFDKIKDIIADRINIDVSQIALENHFDDMKIDSLYMVEIMLAIEDEFNITIDNAEGLETVGDLVKYVEDKQNA